MSLCDTCHAPGHCCRKFTVSGTWPSDPDDAVQAARAAGLPFEPLEVTAHGWNWSCPLLGADGRCTEYESRPELCRNYKPGQDALCVMDGATVAKVRPVNNEGETEMAKEQKTESWHCAFPSGAEESWGLTAREYAALKLRVPLSGTPWLDEMIGAARKADLAQAFLASQFHPEWNAEYARYCTQEAVRCIETIMQVLGNGKGDGPAQAEGGAS